jgi:nucleotide-binding universal stress UspA family protein
MAKVHGARITAFYAAPEYHPDISGDYFPASFVSRSVFEKHIKKTADTFLGQVKKLATAAKVPCTTLATNSDSPYLAIIKTAKSRKCDLIFMASHGRSGIARLLIGSETNKVLTHCKLPVLVHR